jgi:hypothetical protein
VAKVGENTLAAQQGLHEGDVILRVCIAPGSVDF